ncbi:dihydrofolate reductase [Kerstersia gyiorum]|jgi:dihydrofolate reductase|uniref:Dihydrofolate reductase n=1 Tax=Kerstersia gyiorum TaxID=206506 RepID=A0A171KW66_9BURK|nr:dihydrofolate reductase [Kerstersia gyiorum]MCO7635668.1 dihydrofolate reductase [Pseudomonas sp. S 311-6]KKO73133.1 dihydrofolate reductase [Kerstersia gyiorum]MCH4273179.1 dihydrofolate reductase [Kerstersia gyiorum]MCP1632345.1 dihydrofolate reductase [Kerstersia gyiorum]MCP1635148.1 dihydrofolate reductase [Kerstersia gyiorum]
MSAKLAAPDLIVAYAANRVIGRDNTLPWRLPGDLAHFKRSTLGHPVIMGRNTWESLGRPLPGRLNIVISRNSCYEAAGASVYPSLEAALAACTAEASPYIIGGAQIYRLALPLARRVVATEVHASIEGDAYFPQLPGDEWMETSRSERQTENGYEYDFVVYERKTSPAAA